MMMMMMMSVWWRDWVASACVCLMSGGACGISSSSSHSSVSVDDEPNMRYLFRARCRTDYSSSTPHIDHSDALHFKVSLLQYNTSTTTTRPVYYQLWRDDRLITVTQLTRRQSRCVYLLSNRTWILHQVRE